MGFFAACAVSGVVAWGIVLTGFCSDPRVSTPESGHVIPYNCHGMTVFISPLEESLKEWLIPLFILLAVLGVFAAVAFALLAHADVRVDVRVDMKGAKD